MLAREIAVPRARAALAPGNGALAALNDHGRWLLALHRRARLASLQGWHGRAGRGSF